jgi:hypothetical protein
MTDQEFETTLARYKQNLTDYKATGNAGLNVAVERDKTWLDTYIANREQQVVQQQQYIQNFVADYQNTNPELVEMHEKLKEIKKQGPELQDAYETEKQASEEEPIDFTPYYVKAALIVGVAAVVALVGVFRPVYTI